MMQLISNILSTCKYITSRDDICYVICWHVVVKKARLSGPPGESSLTDCIASISHRFFSINRNFFRATLPLGGHERIAVYLSVSLFMTYALVTQER